MNNQQDITAVIEKLQDLQTIRSKAQYLLQEARRDKLAYFRIHDASLETAAQFVIQVMTENYPDLQIPWHSRWRHFEAGGIPRIDVLCLDRLPVEERGKIQIELAIVSVLLDAGAGLAWRYKDEDSGLYFSRSEGLALASLAMYEHGVFSFNLDDPLRVDAGALLTCTQADLQRGFQVSQENPLLGLDGRLMLLNRLGQAILEQPQYFGEQGRLGDFFLYLRSLSKDNRLEASCVFQAVLKALGAVWPTRLELGGYPLGDVWIHSHLRTDVLGSEYMPFHKLSQWLTYSLLEPLQHCGLIIEGLEALTGLPEYRNGGLLLDSGVLVLKDPKLLGQAFEAGEEIIVEWRALTVALLDELAEHIRSQLQLTAGQLPLVSILQGGTWEAGRKIARELRHDGDPPLHLISDGTVF